MGAPESARGTAGAANAPFAGTAADGKRCVCGREEGTVTLYHGSSAAIAAPDVSLNKGFSDLGRGFYLTDDPVVAEARASSRARIDGVEAGVVSAYEFDLDSVTWVVWGSDVSVPEGKPFGLAFSPTVEGMAAWANYIKSCRKGRTEVPGLGDPSVVRAWIATDDVEMVCAGFAPADALAEFIDPADLTVQYCFRSQALVDASLRFLW